MAIETNELIDVQTLSPFKRFIMTIGNLPTSYLESMTYGEMLMWFCNYLQETVIPTVNNNAEAVEELQGLFIELKNYVDEYFDNLDVQQEINNKLDAMVEDGTLTTLIGAYVQPRIDDQNIVIQGIDQYVRDKLSEQDIKIDDLTSGSPLVASSTSEMTETDRIYVNTTDGKWYYYDGDSWEIGGTYQSAEDSTTVNKLVNFSPLFAKYIQNNTIVIAKTETALTVAPKSNANTYVFTENNFKALTVSELTTSFALADYNIASGTWFLYVSITDGVNPTEIKLIASTSSKTWKPNDIILAIIRPTQLISLVPYGITYNGVDIGYVVRSYGYQIPQGSYNRFNVANDTTAKTFTITTGGSQVVLMTNMEFTSIPANTNTTLSYDINTSISSLAGVIWSPFNAQLQLINLPTSSGARDNIISGSVYTKIYGDVLLFIYHIPTGKIFPLINEFYYNGTLISKDKYDSQITNLQNQINTLNVAKYDFLRCFKNFTFIGDSLTAGFVSVDGHTISSADAKTGNNNWPSYLCSRLNRTFTNLSQGSSTIENWRYANQTGNPDTDIENADITTGIYFVALGVNDLRNNLSVGTSSDIDESDYTQNANSVYGNYDYIINKLKEFNPTAKIFTFTIPNDQSGASTYNAPIKYVSNLYDNVYCIDLYELYDFTSGFMHNNYYNGHYDPIGYNYLSLLIESAVNDYIAENYTEFNLVPYNY